MSIIQTAERSSGEDASENVIFQRHLIAYKKAAELVKKNILEIGCGEGYGIKELLPKVEKYICIDKYESNINFKSDKLTFIKSEVPPLNKIKSDSLDFVVTFQVIEHIENDKFFVEEIFRVLKSGGVAILQVPINFKRNETFEDQSIISKKDREKYFGQYDHVREYGLDFKERVEKAGFKIEMVYYTENFSEEMKLKYGLQKNDVIPIARKSFSN